jgi:hypothetical protein
MPPEFGGMYWSRFAVIDQTGFAPEQPAAIDAVATDDPDTDLWRSASVIGVETGAPQAATMRP